MECMMCVGHAREDGGRLGETQCTRYAGDLE